MTIRVAAFIHDDEVGVGGLCTERRFRSRRKALEHAQRVSLGTANYNDGPKRALIKGASKHWDVWFHPGGRLERRERELWGYST